MIAEIGLSIVVLAWIIQFVHMDKKKRISIYFIATYIIGVALLIYDGFSNGLNVLATANLVSLIVALVVLIRLKFY